MPSDSIPDVNDDGKSGLLQHDEQSRPSDKHGQMEPHQAMTATTTVRSEDAKTKIQDASFRDNRNTGWASWFAIPAPLKQLFDRFPLLTYDENDFPTRALSRGKEHVLYIFTTKRGAMTGRPSFNPSCLRWQTYLKLSDISFETRPSNNHASPTGALPFLLLVGTSALRGTPTSEVVAGSRIQKWAIDRTAASEKTQQASDIGYGVFASLLDHRIRKAWLFQLYLDPANEVVVRRLYTQQCSSNAIVQMTIGSQLKAAAEIEVGKASARSSHEIRVDEAAILQDADEAFAALSTQLGSRSWFHGPLPSEAGASGKPGLFDASVFAYTHLILDSMEPIGEELMGWKSNALGDVLEKYENLMAHRKRMLELYY